MTSEIEKVESAPILNLVSLNQDGRPVTTSTAIACGVGNPHATVIKLVRQNMIDLQEFGGVGFEIQPFETPGGTQNREVAVLNEQQATLLMTYMRNNDVVRDFKKRLVKAFYAFAQGGSDQLTVTGLDPSVARQIGGIVKAIMHKEISAILPAMVEQEVATKHLSVTRGVTASQVLDMAGLQNRKGMRGMAVRVSNRLRRFHAEKGVALKIGELGPTSRYLFDPLTAREWLSIGGQSSIDLWAKEKAGQGRLKLVPKAGD